MPLLSERTSSQTIKLLFIGESGSGKTGALMALAAAGYNVRILDLDNGVDILEDLSTQPRYAGIPPERLSAITITETMKIIGNKVYPSKGDVWQKSINLLANWVDGERRYGAIKTWTPNDVLVIDSLTFLAKAAHNAHLALNGKLFKEVSQNEGRRDIGAAQSMIEDLLKLLYDVSVPCHVILISHVTYTNATSGSQPDRDSEQHWIGGQGFPSAIGRALSPRIPRYFNNMLICRTVGAGLHAKHRIFPTAQIVEGQVINAKTTRPSKMPPEFPIETGLADFFRLIRGPGPEEKSKVPS